MEKATLVLGGTGKTGRRVARRLTERGIPVRIGSRHGDPPFDWDDTSTWKPVLEDVGAVYITYYPDLAVPGASAAVGAFIETALASGVERLILLPGCGEEEAQLCENHPQQSGAQWTIVRASWFADVVVASLVDPVHMGKLYEVTGSRALSFEETLRDSWCICSPLCSTAGMARPATGIWSGVPVSWCAGDWRLATGD